MHFSFFAYFYIIVVYCLLISLMCFFSSNDFCILVLCVFFFLLWIWLEWQLKTWVWTLELHLEKTTYQIDFYKCFLNVLSTINTVLFPSSVFGLKQTLKWPFHLSWAEHVELDWTETWHQQLCCRAAGSLFITVCGQSQM